jgi:hypothetical protein
MVWVWRLASMDKVRYNLNILSKKTTGKIKFGRNWYR